MYNLSYRLFRISSVIGLANRGLKFLFEIVGVETSFATVNISKLATIAGIQPTSVATSTVSLLLSIKN